jgi:hypothetical protein
MAAMKDQNYTDVIYNSHNKTYTATHKGHMFNEATGWTEKAAQTMLANDGHTVVLEKESGKPIGESYLDGKIDGLGMEISNSNNPTANNLKKKLNHCADKRADVAVVYINGKYCIGEIYRAVARYDGTGRRKFKLIYFVGNDGIITTRNYN